VAAEQALREVARQSGLRLVGPNCAGIVNTKWSLFPTLETRPPSGDVAFVSQSGALGGAVLSWAEEQGVGFSKFVSYGNGADLTDVDFLDALREDAESRVVCIYIETVSDGRDFLDAASRLAAEKPLLVIKAGRSDAGGRATLSHTGSIAGSDAVYDAALRQCGAIRVDGIEAMFDLCRAFACLGPIRGGRLAIVTNSGGPGVLAADRAEALGLDVAPPSEALRESLEARLPSFCGFDNPFDLTVQGGETEYRETIRAVATEYDAVLALNVNVPYLDSTPLARGVVDAAKAVDVPVAASFLAGRTIEAALPILEAGGVPTFATGERAVAAFASLARQTLTAESLFDSAVSAASIVSDARTSTAEGRTPSALADDSVRLHEEGLPWEETPLEPEAMAWLERQGIRVIEREVAGTEDEAVAAARRLGFPVAAKAVSRTILHKTDVDGVALDLESETAVRAAFSRLARLDAFEGVVVSRMVAHPVEALVGLSRDPQFGPVVAVGLGGIYAETLGDVSLRVAPIVTSEARRMIAELRGEPILRGARRRREHDVGALADLVATVSELGARFPDLVELDLNPVFLFEHGCAVADARLIVRQASERSSTR
jgi:acyl-CoA synthetase (NDP forming)